MKHKIEVKNLTKTYKSKKGQAVTALDNINIEFPSKGMIFILGKSGSGKSTLLNLLGGLDNYDSGEIIIKGKTSKTFTQNDFDSYRNTYLGFIFQEYNILEEFNIYSNVGLALELQHQKANKDVIDQILNKVGLEGLGQRNPQELSGGQKQRVAIARALVKNPEIILADEPTGALDSSTGTQILKLLKELSQEKLVIIVSHDRENAIKFADRIIEFKDGKIISDENKLEIDETNSNEFKLINSSLSNKHALKIGASSLKYKPFRLVLTILLAFLSFALFGLSDTLGNFNETTATAQSIIDLNINISGYEKKEIFTNEFGIELEDTTAFTKEEYETFTTKYDVNSYKSISDYYLFRDAFERYDTTNVYYYGFSSDASGVVNVTNEDLNTLNYTINGQLPQNKNEIALTNYLAELFLNNEVTVYDDNQTPIKITINNIEDLIGKNIEVKDLETTNIFKVTGLINTNMDTKYDVPNLITEYDLFEEMRNYREYGFHSKIFVSNEYFTEIEQIKANTNNGKIYDMILFQTPERETLEEIISTTQSEEYPMYTIKNSSYRTILETSYFVTDLTPIAFYTGLFFAIFSAVLLFNFISISISYKQKEIGILRAIGARSIDIFKIFFYETLIIGLINFVLSSITLVIAVYFINEYLKSGIGLELTVFILSIRQFILLLTLSILVSFISSFIPVNKISRKKPIDSIRKI